MAEDAEPGSRHGAQGGARPRSVRGRIRGNRGRGSCRPPSQRSRSPCSASSLPGSPPRSSARRRATEPIRGWSSAATRTSSSTCRRSAASWSARHPVPGRPELDVDPGLGLLVRRGGRVVVPADAEDPAQPAGHVPAHPQQRVHDQQDLGLVPVQFGGDRVDQVGHVVGDDVHHQARTGSPGSGARRRARGPGPGPGPAAGAGRAGRALRRPSPAATAGPGPRWRRAGNRRSGSRKRCRRRSRRPEPARPGRDRPSTPRAPWPAGRPWLHPRNRPASRPLLRVH